MSSVALDRMFLEEVCPTLRDRLVQKLVDEPQICCPEQDFQDFEVSYSFSCEASSLQLQVHYPFLAQLLQKGSQALLERVWDGLPLRLRVHDGILDVTVDISSLGEDLTARQRCADLLAGSRMWLLIGPLVQQLRWLRDQAASTAPPAMLSFQARNLETCWIVSKPDRVSVIFSMHLDDEVDVTLGRAFCTEFAETNRKANDFSLPCTFSEPKDPPIDLRDIQIANIPNVGYLTLTLSDQCVRGVSDDRLYALARPVMTFRNFFHFHLKHTKSYIHSRLRKRLDLWQQQLSRARRQPRRGQERLRRLKSGKVFDPAPRTAGEGSNSVA